MKSRFYTAYLLLKLYKGCVKMKSITTRVAYLEGLIAGMEMDKSSKEGRVIVELSSILKDIAEELENIREDQYELEEYVDTLDEDLSNIEEDLYYDEDDEDCDCDCEDDEYGNYINFECPNCNETIYIDSDICNNNEEINCPNCHKQISLDCCEEKN
jgi:predicted RNA-binding Zn-ribbon protein involved in translation (DUF1610 family)